jgi:hypothetical protein
MNKRFVLFNLREAKEELERMIRELEDDPKYDDADFVVAMSHLYHHLNTAWNARDSSESEAVECSQQNFDRWRQFPSAEEVLLDESKS